jgi:hypothetical protein
MVLFIVTYLYRKITQEIRDNCKKSQEVIGYHVTEVKNTFQLRKKRKILQKKMRRAKNYEEWRSVAEEFDSLPSKNKEKNPNK